MKLTIFTPTYNRAYTLQRLFESLQRQSDKRFEWLICDDGSEDNTEEIIKQFIDQTDDFQIKYLKQKDLKYLKDTLLFREIVQLLKTLVMFQEH